MPIKHTFDTRESVPEFLANAVVEQDGKFVLEAETSNEIKTLRDTLRKERELRSSKETELKRFERFKEVKDEDWDLYEDWRRTRDSEGEDGGNGQSQGGDRAALEKAIAREKDRFTRQLGDKDRLVKERDERIGQLEKQIREFSIWTPVRDLAVKHEVLPDRLDAFLKVLRSDGRFDLDDKNSLVFKDAEGYPTTLKAEEAFKQALKDEFPWAFKGLGSGGSGALVNQDEHSRGAIVLSREEAKDPRKYRAAKEQAQKNNVPFQIRD